MLKYFSKYKFKIIMGVSSKLMEAVFEILLPILMIDLINNGIVANNMNHVYKVALLMLVFIVSGYLFSLICQVFASIVSQQIGGTLRSELFTHIAGFSKLDYERFQTSQLTNRVLNDTNQVQMFVALVIRLAVRAPFIIIGSIVALYLLNPTLGLILLISIPLFLITAVLFMYLSSKEQKKAQNALDKLIHKVKEIISGTRVIRAFRKEKVEEHKFQELNELLSERQKKVSLIQSVSSPTITILMNIVLLVLIYQGALRVGEGTMDPGHMVAVINYATQLVLALIVFMNLVMIFSKGFVSFKRIKEVLDYEPTLKNEGMLKISDKIELLEFQNVSFSYPNESRKILDEISFRLESGKTLGIIGLTGSGKSTLSKMITRFFDPSSGTIYINNNRLQDYELSSLREQVAYVGQEAEMLDASLEENLRMNHEIDAVRNLKIAEGLDILEKGLDYRVQGNGMNLSGGQRQRVSIARSLTKNFSLIILDDSFSALDYLTDYRLRSNLKKVYPDKAKMIISQRISSIKDADEIIFLADGKIESQGTHDELLKSSELYKSIYKLQVEDQNEL